MLLAWKLRAQTATRFLEFRHGLDFLVSFLGATRCGSRFSECFRKDTAVTTPIIGWLAAIAAALGLYSLVWYHSLTKEEREQADRLTIEYAKALYNKAVNQLTKLQLDRVLELVKIHFGK